MPWLDILWTDDVLEKVQERGIEQDEVYELIRNSTRFERSRSTGLPLVRGTVASGRYLVVIFDWVDDITVQIVTAFTPDRD